MLSKLDDIYVQLASPFSIEIIAIVIIVASMITILIHYSYSHICD
jgi:hypothetical protein